MNLSSKARPMIDELKNGRWPSYIKEIEKSAADGSAKHSKQCTELLNLLEDSFEEKRPHWKHGGIVGVRSYGGGVIGRYTDDPVKYPDLTEFHTIRVNQPSGWFYKSDDIRTALPATLYLSVPLPIIYSLASMICPRQVGTWAVPVLT